MYNLLIFKCWQFIFLKNDMGTTVQPLIYSITVGQVGGLVIF